MSGLAYQAAKIKAYMAIGRPGPARLRHNQACRLRAGQIPENFDRLGPALLKPSLPGPLGTLWKRVDMNSDLAKPANSVLFAHRNAYHYR